MVFRLNLPNFLTLIRILTIPFFLVLLSSKLYLEALIVFFIGGVTDILDGALARMTGQQTSLGAYLDPIADKLLIMSSYIMLAFIGGIPLWFAVLVVSRDIILLFGYGVVYLSTGERLKIQPTPAGKLNTLFQLATVVVVMIVLYDSRLLTDSLRQAFILVTALFTVVSGVQYIYRGLVWLQGRASSSTA